MLKKKEALEVLFVRGVKKGTKKYLATLSETMDYKIGELVDISVGLLRDKQEKNSARRKKKAN